MKKTLVFALALLVGSCTPLCMSSDETRAEARAAAGDIVQGTVRSIGEVVPVEADEAHTRYEDPLEEPRLHVVVALDDGSEVTLLYAGPRDIERGQRVRVYLGERAAVLL